MRLSYLKTIQSLEETLKRKSSRTQPWLLSSFSSYSSDPLPKKPKLAPLQERKMIDKFRLYAKAGDGGNGCCSSRRSRHDRHGKPDGGGGGRGGDVILECSPTVWDFSSLQHHINAKRGGHGSSKNLIGTRGTDKVVLVPVGTVIHLVDGEIPTVIEKSSSTVLDPWDIPSTLGDGSLAFNDPSTSTTPSTIVNNIDALGGLSHVKDIVKDSGGMKQNARSLSTKYRPPFPPSSRGSRVQMYELKFESEGKDVLTNDDGIVKDSGGMKQNAKSLSTEYRPPLRLSNKGSRVQMYEIKFESEGEDVLTNDDGMSEAEWEEEIDENDEEEEQVDEEEEEIEYDVAELTKQGQRVVIACGGEGGLGNISFPKISRSTKSKPGTKKNVAIDPKASDTDQSSLTAGLPGSQTTLVLELKSIADVGLVGMPNAGKSTLLGAISRAQPTIGHYAFTTMRPNLGKLNFDDISVTVADIPGLIKGAHENRGLGHAFLRHIERTKVLAYVVDLAAGLDGRKGIPPWEQLRDLMSELEHHLEGLSTRSSIVVANKIDEPGTDCVLEELKRRVQGVPIYPVCAILDDGIPELKAGLRMLVNGGESGGILSVDEIKLD